MAKSLLEGMNMGATGAAPAKRAGKRNEGGKLIFALALLVVAGVVVAWSQGWIFKGASLPQQSPEEAAQQQQEFQQQKTRTEELQKTNKAVQSGSS